MVTELTDATFASDTNEGVYVTDMYATWCGPCKMQAPVIDQLAEEYAGKVKFGKLDVDKNQATPQEFGVMSIPTLLVKKDGQVIDTLVGLHSKEQLEAKLNSYLA